MADSVIAADVGRVIARLRKIADMTDSVISADFGRVIAQLRKMADKAPSSMADDFACATYALECLSMALAPNLEINEWESLGLTPNERRIMSILKSHMGNVVTKEAMLNGLYALKEDAAEPKIIDIYLCKIRRKMRAHGSPYRIQTVWGIGYKLVSKTEFKPTACAVAQFPNGAAAA